MSISSYVVRYCRVISLPARAALKVPVWSRWYVPWLAAALALAGLMLGAITALEILIAPPQLTPSSHREPVEELVPDMESISAER